MPPPDRRDRRDDDFDDDRPGRGRRDDRDMDRDDFDDDYRPGRPRGGASGAETTSLIMGIAAIVIGLIGGAFSLFPCVGWVIGFPIGGLGLVLAVVGLICGFVGRKRSGGMRAGGLVTSGIGAVISLLGIGVGVAWLVMFGASVNSAQQNVVKMAEQADKMAKEAEQRAKEEEAKRLEEDRKLREGPATPVTADQLSADYRTNPFQGDNSYKGKALEVTGTLRQAPTEQFGKVIVELNTTAAPVVRCEFPREARAQLMNLRVLQQVTVRGKCKGKERPLGAAGEAVVLENCLLTQPDPKTGPVIKDPWDVEPKKKPDGKKEDAAYAEMRALLVAVKEYAAENKGAYPKFLTQAGRYMGNPGRDAYVDPWGADYKLSFEGFGPDRKPVITTVNPETGNQLVVK